MDHGADVTTEILVSTGAIGRIACLTAAAALAIATLPGRLSAQPSVRDTLPRHVRSSLSPYRSHPSIRDVRGELERWARAGGPVSAGDSLAMAAMWRRAGQHRSALESLPSTYGSDGLIRPMVELERARILLQAPASGPGVPGTYEERRRLGGNAFWQACESMDDETRQALWQDLRGLTTPEEQSAWADLPTGPETCAWVRRLVDERAFRMTTSVEERLQIHYARLHEARRRFYIRTPRLTRDLANHLGRADSLEIDDRGLILLRMGEPLAIVAPFMDLNETWAYYRPEGPRVFHFAPVSKTGLRALGDYRLLENLAHASGFTMPSELMGIGGGRFAYLYQSRRVLDFLFDEAHFRRMDTRMRAAGDRFNPGFQGFLAWERELNEADARYAVSGIPDAPDLSAAIEFAYETLRFREAGSDRTEVYFLASTRAGDLTAMASDDGAVEGAVSYHMAATLSWLGPDGAERVETESRPTLPDALRADDGLPVRLPLVLEPGTYPFTLALRDRGAHRSDLGNWVLDTVVVSARQAGLPSLSDLAVAADSGGSWSRDGRTYLPIDPTHVAGSDGSAHVYFEVYGVLPGGRYEVQVEVAADSAAGRVLETGTQEPAFAVSFEATSEADVAGRGLGTHYLRVELADSPPGAYLLTVRAIDRRTGIASLPAVTPLYLPADRGTHWTEAPRRRSTIIHP